MTDIESHFDFGFYSALLLVGVLNVIVEKKLPSIPIGCFIGYFVPNLIFKRKERDQR